MKNGTLITTWKVKDKSSVLKVPVTITEGGMYSVERISKRMEDYNNVTNWKLVDSKGNTISSKRNESEILKDDDKEKKALALYEELGNYAKVARELGINPTTVRTWCKKAKETSNEHSAD
jgi:DNA invertase Pin-like site-specific DNA recombinase